MRKSVKCILAAAVILSFLACLAGCCCAESIGSEETTVCYAEYSCRVPEGRDTEAVLNGTVRILSERLQDRGCTDAVVRREGESTIRLEIPLSGEYESVLDAIARECGLTFTATEPSEAETLPELEDLPVLSADALTVVRTESTENFFLPVFGETAEVIPMTTSTVYLQLILQNEEDVRNLLDAVCEPAVLQFIDHNGEPFITGNMVREAAVVAAETPGDEAHYGVEFALDDEGTKLFAEKTAQSVGRMITVRLEDRILFSATIQEAITNGRIALSGLNEEAAIDMAEKIQAAAAWPEMTLESFGQLP